MTLPKKLKILDGKRWTGKIEVRGRTPEGSYVCAFDAEDTRAVSERYVYDIATLTPQQIIDWTGVDPRTWEQPK
jgi:hypothetical protein